METSKGITVSKEDIESFFSDIRKTFVKKEGGLTDSQKTMIVHAYEFGYNKEETSKVGS